MSKNQEPARTHCPNGHALTADAVYTSPNGARSCLICRRMRAAAANTTSTSIRINLSTRTRERMRSIKERTEATSYAQVVREALRHYEAALDEIRATAGRITTAGSQ